MKKMFGICLIFILLLSGCGKKVNEAYEEQLDLAFLAVQEEKYNKAKGYFEWAQKLEPNEQYLKLYIDQLEYIIEAKKQAHSGDYEEAVGCLDKAIKLKKGSLLIAEKAKRTKEKILLL